MPIPKLLRIFEFSGNVFYLDVYLHILTLKKPLKNA